MNTKHLKSGWKIMKFGDVVKNANLVERDPVANGVDRIVGLEHIDPENLHIRRWNSVADGTSFTRKFVPGQTLFGKRRAYQRKVAYAEFEGICSGDILTFETKDKSVLLPELLPFICQSDAFFDHALGTSAGSLSPRTSWTALKDFEFPLPPLDEQKRIAEILLTADEAVERWKSSRNDLVELSKCFAVSTFGESNKHQKSKLCDVTRKIGSGKTPRGGQTVYTEEGVIFLRSQNIYPRGLRLDDVAFIPKEIDKEMSSTRVEYEDVLLNITGASIGRCTIYNRRGSANVNQHVCIIRPKTEEIDSWYLQYFLQSAYGQKLITTFSTKGNREGLNFQQLGGFEIPLPNLQEQKKISDMFRKINQQLHDIDSHIGDGRELMKVLSTGFGGASNV